MDSENLAYSWIIDSNDFLSGICNISIFYITLIKLEVKLAFSSLFLMIVQCVYWINFSSIEMSTVKGVWSNK